LRGFLFRCGEKRIAALGEFGKWVIEKQERDLPDAKRISALYKNLIQRNEEIMKLTY
jgi:hypothetical protein